jgi:hypothetical protein
MFPPEIWEEILLFLHPKFISFAGLISLDFHDLLQINNLHFRLILSQNNKDTNLIYDQLLWAAQEGKLELMQWLSFNKTIDVFNDFVFWTAAENGHLKMLHWLYSTTISTINCKTNFYLFPNVAGHLEVLRWLYSISKFTKQDMCEEDGFKYIIKYGGLEVLNWVHDTFKITKDDIRNKVNGPFYLAIKYDKLEIIKWIHKTQQLGFHIKNANTQPFLLAARYGSLEVLKWLESKFFMVKYTNDYRRSALRKAARYGYLDMFKWVYSLGGNTDIESCFEIAARKNQLNILKLIHSITTSIDGKQLNLAFRKAVEQGNLDIMEWMHCEFKLIVDNDYYYSFRYVACDGNLEVLRWLHSKQYITLKNSKFWAPAAYNQALENEDNVMCNWLLDNTFAN